MSIPSIAFDKTWTNPQDFATVQNDEVQVRADQQYLFDFIANYINNTLIPQIAAEIAAIVISGIADGSITTPKFNAAAVAPMAAKWSEAKNITIADADASHEGAAVSVDGSANAALRLPAIIKAALVGNADTATSAGKWTTARSIQIRDYDATHTSGGVNVDGSGNVLLWLPEHISGTFHGNADTATQAANVSDNAVTTAKIAASAVTTAKINDSAVTTAKINDSAVTTAKINNGAVTRAKMDTYIKLTSGTDYGATLPAAGNAGRIFFKRV